MTYFGRFKKKDAAGVVALPAGKTIEDVTPQPNRAAANLHGLIAGFHRRQSDLLDSKDPEASKKHALAAHAHEAAKFAHNECVEDADGETTAAMAKSGAAIAQPKPDKGKPKK